MRARTSLAAALLALTAVTGCSSDSSDDKPDPTPTTPVATVTQTVDTAAQRAACVDAWAELLQDADAEVDITTDEPAACDGLPAGERTERYMDGLFQRNQANRDRIDECLEDPACTSIPIG